MSSLKMTFSLASLILILGLVFVATPAMAQSDINQIADFATSGTFQPDGTTAATFGDATVNDITGATEVPAKGFLILTKASDDGAAFLGSIGDETDVTVVQWPDMPNLEDLFFQGGTMLLKRTKFAADAANDLDNKFDHDGDDDAVSRAGTSLSTAQANDGKADEDEDDVELDPADDDTPDATATVDIAERFLIITEIMWAKDLGLVGLTGEFNHQWIEIYNPHDRAFPLENVVLHLKGEVANEDAINVDDNFIRLDRVSNEVGLGWSITGLGQNGDSRSDPTVPFVSMYRSNRDKEGWTRGHWGHSTAVYLSTPAADPAGAFNNIGTPGALERKEKGSVKESDDPPLTPFIINEFKVGANGWVEIKNVDTAEKSLKNYQLSQVTASGTDTRLASFHDKNYKVPAGGVFLVVSGTRDAIIPETLADSALAGGINVAQPAAEREKKGSSVNYWIPGEFTIMAGESLLVLRKNHEDKHLGTAGEIVDITGGGSFGNADGTTNYWPLIKNGGAHGETVKTDGQDPAKDKAFDDNTVYRRNKADKYRDAETWVNAGFTGIGYKRNAAANNANGGTPGYANDTIKNDGADAIAAVMISEIMYATGDRGVTQWIELRNMSNPIGVNVGSWRLEISNHHQMMDDAGMMVNFTGEYTNHVDLSGTIPPGQSYLIVGRETGRDTTNLPEERIASKDLKRNEMLLNPYGFQLRLIAKRGEAEAKQEEVDVVGNLKPAPATDRRADAQSFNDDVAWKLPSGLNEDGDRVSIIRIPNAADADMMATGTSEDGWMLYTMTQQYNDILDDTYYGHDSDIGSPGHHFGGVLPVSLSKFRPERMKDTGAVVIRWITESELNNAGFNILRSETRDGEFTKINTKLIAGQGTTSERSVYEYADTSAKPNVVYYYQIQDVSLDGQVTTLRTTHLRGNVTAAGKLTTTWGELKALQ